MDAVKFWGAYFPGDAGGGDPLPDNFTVKFRLNDDSTGIDLPGPVISKVQFGPATTRVTTGTTLFGVREFEYTIELDSNPDLLPGNYWVQIYNDTTPDPTDDTWFWETGLLDPVNGLPGSAFSGDPPNLPGETWTIDAVQSLSVDITCKPPGVLVCDDCSDGDVDECNGDPTCQECETPAGDCVCVQDVPCVKIQEPCPDGTCPPGFFCCTNTCCGGSWCLPLCGSPLAAQPPLFVSPDGIFSGGAAVDEQE